jgi:O-antigen/teichoic acid export membrane protein
MNSKLAMTSASIVLGASGLLLIFLPQEMASTLEWSDDSAVLLQLIGATYFGFAMLNWMARGTLVGGIYGRPIVIGNLTHFVIGASIMIKQAISNPSIVVLVVAAVVYIAFALIFGYMMTHHPIKEKNQV